MTTETYGTLRHCLMAGMCSAAETTGTLGIADGAYASERDRLNQAKWRCPYSANTSAQYTKKSTDLQHFSYRRVSLHCERDWIEENS